VECLCFGTRVTSVCPLCCPPARCNCFPNPEPNISSLARLGEEQGCLCIPPRLHAPLAEGSVLIPSTPLRTSSSTFWGPKHLPMLHSCFPRLDTTHLVLHPAFLPAGTRRGFATGRRGPCREFPTLFPKHQIIPEALDTVI